MSRITLTDSTNVDWFYPRLLIAHQSGTITASTTATGYSASAIATPLTYTGWKANALTATIENAYSGSKTISYMAIYVTDIGTAATVTPQYWDGAAWQDFGTGLLLTKRGPAAWMKITGVSTTKTRLSIAGTAAPTIAFFAQGAATVMPCGIPPGFEPASLNQEDEFTNEFTEGGQVLSAQLIRSRAVQSVSMDGVTPSWVSTNWGTIRGLMNTNGMFFAFNPKDNADELIYGMRNGKPKAAYSASQYMSLSFAIEGPEIEL